MVKTMVRRTYIVPRRIIAPMSSRSYLRTPKARMTAGMKLKFPMGYMLNPLTGRMFRDMRNELRPRPHRIYLIRLRFRLSRVRFIPVKRVYRQ